MKTTHDPVFRAMLARRVAVAALVALVVVCLVVVTYGVVVIRESQVTNTARSRDSQQTVDRINDCTTPGRKCFDDGQRRSARAIDALNQGSAAAAAAAAACADRPDVKGYREIKACVDSTLAEQRP